jgi:hypothetical protein
MANDEFIRGADTNWFKVAKRDLNPHLRPAAAEAITGAVIAAIEAQPDAPLVVCGKAAITAAQELLADLHEFAHSGVPLDDLVCEIDSLFLEVHR